MASVTDGISDNGNGCVRARVILQQCFSAKLMVQPYADTEEAKYVQVNRGMIVYLCFMEGADELMLDKMVKSVLGAKLSKSGNGKLVSVLDLPGDVLIIPQTTLGGNLRAKRMQYHKNINKDDGLLLYTKCVRMFEEMMSMSDKSKEMQTVVRCGKYGNKQEVFSFETDGPSTHILDF